MQIVKLMGGLGNQMFEFAFAFALSKKLKTNVKLDLSWFDEIKNLDGNVDKRVYELGAFNVVFDIATRSEIEKCLNKKRCYLPKILRKLFKKDKYISNTIVEHQAQVFQPELLLSRHNAYYEGYYQSEKYFSDIREDVLNSFMLNLPLDNQNQEMLNKIKSVNSISLHVRRGDYVNLQDTYQLCSLNYYTKAIEYIAKYTQNPHFFLFSDDINWVVTNLKINYPYTVVDINDASKGCFDLELMKNCNHNIIANSSFSWWGAWLNHNNKKIVVAPKKWFATSKLFSTDIIPDSWVKI